MSPAQPPGPFLRVAPFSPENAPRPRSPNSARNRVSPQKSLGLRFSSHVAWGKAFGPETGTRRTQTAPLHIWVSWERPAFPQTEPRDSEAEPSPLRCRGAGSRRTAKPGAASAGRPVLRQAPEGKAASLPAQGLHSPRNGALSSRSRRVEAAVQATGARCGCRGSNLRARGENLGRLEASGLPWITTKRRQRQKRDAAAAFGKAGQGRADSGLGVSPRSVARGPNEEGRVGDRQMTGRSAPSFRPSVRPSPSASLLFPSLPPSLLGSRLGRGPPWLPGSPSCADQDRGAQAVQALQQDGREEDSGRGSVLQGPEDPKGEEKEAGSASFLSPPGAFDLCCRRRPAE